MPEFEGVPVMIAGKEWIIPALNLTTIKRLRPQIDSLASIAMDMNITDKQIDVFIEIIHSALARNYPEITKENVADMVTFANATPIISAVMGVSGFVSSGGAKADGPIGT